MIVTSRNYDNDTKSGVEPWYETKYRSLRLTDEQIAAWTQLTPTPALFLPARNIFVPEQFDVRDRSSSPSLPSKFPTIVHVSPITRVWHKLDDSFLKPKANICADNLASLAACNL